MSLLDAVVRELTDRARPRVALLARRAKPPLAARLSEAVPGVEVVVVAVADQPLVRLHARLTASGPYDVVVDLAGDGVEERWRRFLFHTVPGGAYVVRVADDALHRELTHLLELRGGQPDHDAAPDPVRSRDRATLAESLDRVETGPGFVVIGNRAATLATVHEHLVNAMLGKGRLDAEVVHTVPAQRFTSTAVRRLHGTGQVPTLPTSYDAPVLHLRRWDDVVCLPRQIAIQSGVLLPASHAVRTQKRLGHLMLTPWAPGFVQAPEIAEVRRLSGSYYYLDNQLRGHFGHALAEQVAVTWGWERALALDPEVRALVAERPGSEVATWELDLLAAAGIPRDRVEVIDGPARVERLFTATPTLSRGEYVHPESARTYAVIGESLARQATTRDWPAKVFLTRAPGNRTCHNVADVEALHRRHGFEVVLPEKLSLADQVRLVREAGFISGFAGSGMFQIAFAGGPKRVVAISSESYHVHNEQIFADLLGHRLDVVWCRADVRRGDRFDARAFQSSFTLDLEREGVALESLLSSAGS